jgi:hypothetical protein
MDVEVLSAVVEAASVKQYDTPTTPQRQVRLAWNRGGERQRGFLIPNRCTIDCEARERCVSFGQCCRCCSSWSSRQGLLRAVCACVCVCVCVCACVCMFASRSSLSLSLSVAFSLFALFALSLSLFFSLPISLPLCISVHVAVSVCNICSCPCSHAASKHILPLSVPLHLPSCALPPSSSLLTTTQSHRWRQWFTSCEFCPTRNRHHCG